MFVNNLVSTIGFQNRNRVIVVKDSSFQLKPVHQVCDDRDFILDHFLHRLILQGGANVH